jgi:exopolysaccharide biosynthesis protein
MKVKRPISAIMVLLLVAGANGQTVPGADGLTGIEWNASQVTKGVMLKSVQTRLFDSFQAIYVIDIDTTAGKFEFGVAVPDTRLVTSAIAASEGVLAAVNGTFFNMQEGYNVHFVKVNDSVVAVTDDKEYGIRATGLFSADGEAVDISAWGPEREDRRAVTAGDAIVSGPLLMDDGREILLDSINFNTLRHPRTMIGATGDGHILFIVVDGRQPEYAEGMSLFELRALARSLGCTEILNLDGGGSTAMYLRDEGSNGVVNRPSGKVERAVPSIVFVRKIE